MQTISIIGFGRFGKTLYRLLKDDFIITLYNRSEIKGHDLTPQTKATDLLEEVYKNDVIFYAIPIAAFEETIKEHQKYFHENQLLIDVLSVKVYPTKVLNRYLSKSKTQALLTHPLFGPDSSKNGFSGLPLIINKFLADEKNYAFWKNYFIQKKLRVIEMTSEEHDRLAANSQGVTHFIGRLLQEFDFQPTPIDSKGTEKLLEVMDQTCNDTWQLFTDLQQYNPYTKDMRIKLGMNFDRLYNKLLPEQVDPTKITYGIQGGKGSFNEEAIHYFLQRTNRHPYRIVYLHTTEEVIDHLHRGEIDRGQFAIHNSLGGMVEESIHAMAKYKFKIIDQYAIKIAHALMIQKNADLGKIDTIMTHPQVLSQCKTALLNKYPQLELISGEGPLIDHALIAKNMSEGKLPSNIATMGSKKLAEMYNLTIVEDNLQDAPENYTSFLQVARI